MADVDRGRKARVDIKDNTPLRQKGLGQRGTRG